MPHVVQLSSVGGQTVLLVPRLCRGGGVVVAWQVISSSLLHSLSGVRGAGRCCGDLLRTVHVQPSLLRLGLWCTQVDAL